jgi:hypothetical protein
MAFARFHLFMITASFEGCEWGLKSWREILTWFEAIGKRSLCLKAEDGLATVQIDGRDE